MKKMFSAICSLLLLPGIFATGENYILSPVHFNCEGKISILYETVCFHEETVESKVCIKNTGDKKLECGMEIVCTPICDDASSVGAFLPDDFSIKEAGVEKEFDVVYEGKIYSKSQSYDVHATSASTIICSFSILPAETKLFEISFKDLTFDGYGVSRLSKYSFNSSSMRKTANYISKDNPHDVDSEIYALEKFVYADEEKVHAPRKVYRPMLKSLYHEDREISKNICRKIENGELMWSLTLPETCNEIGCVQLEFHFMGDRSPLSMCYPYPYEAYSYDNENAPFRFKCEPLNRNLLPKEFLFFLSRQELSVLRNAFYAAHGYDLKNRELKKYFDDTCIRMGVRYHVNPNFSKSDFNEIEWKNIELIRKMENTTEPKKLSDF